MRHFSKRCIHCKDQYSFQASGHGCHEPLNDEKYCPSCKALIREALSAAPKKYRERHRPVSEIPRFAELDLETMLAWEAKQNKEREGKLMGQRIWPGLFKLDANSNDLKDHQRVREVGGEGDHKGFRFKLSTWSKSDEHEIKVQMEFDEIAQEWTGRRW